MLLNMRKALTSILVKSDMSKNSRNHNKKPLNLLLHIIFFKLFFTTFNMLFDFFLFHCKIVTRNPLLHLAYLISAGHTLITVIIC